MPAGYQRRAHNGGRWQFCTTERKTRPLEGRHLPTAGIDRDMQVTPPGGGNIKVIPPPGTPGGGSKCAAEVVASMLRKLPSAPMATHDTDAQNEARFS